MRGSPPRVLFTGTAAERAALTQVGNLNASTAIYAVRLFWETDTNTLYIDIEGSGWTAIGGGGGSPLLVREEDSSPSDAAVTTIRVPNGTMTVNASGDISLGYEVAGAVAAHVAAIDPHTQYATVTDIATVNVLIGTADPAWAAAITVGTTPGGELGGTWASPTVDATHSGSAHHSSVTIGADAEHSLAGQVLSGVDATTSQKGHAQFDSTTPQAVSTVGTAGVSGIIADRAHVHAHEAAHIAHDTLWDAAGDLVVGSGADTAVKLSITVPAANILEVLGVVNGETTASWKALHDGTNPAAIGTVAPGTALTAAHRDHVHATGAGTPSTQAFGDAAAIGSGPAAAMTDHKHAMPANPVSANGAIRTITFVIDGGGSTITTGVKGFLEIPFACTINRVTLLADASGSIVIDVWKDTYANYPPTVADTITASAKPTITTATKSQDATLTGWTTSITAGDILGFNVDSVTTHKRVTISLKVTET